MIAIIRAWTYKFQEIIQALKDIEYDGTFSTGNFSKPGRLCARKSREYLRFILEEVYGRGKRTENLLVLEKKIIWNITIITVIVAIIFSIYIYSSMQKNAVKRYENQIITNAEVSGKNIDHYIKQYD